MSEFKIAGVVIRGRIIWRIVLISHIDQAEAVLMVDLVRRFHLHGHWVHIQVMHALVERWEVAPSLESQISRFAKGQPTARLEWWRKIFSGVYLMSNGKSSRATIAVTVSQLLQHLVRKPTLCEQQCNYCLLEVAHC